MSHKPVTESNAGRGMSSSCSYSLCQPIRFKAGPRGKSLSGLLNARTTRRTRIAESTQADLQHEGVAEYRRRRGRGIGIGRDIVGRQHEAIIYLYSVDHVLVDLIR